MKPTEGLVLFPLLLAALVVCASCPGAPAPVDAWRPPTVVKIDPGEAWMARSPTYGVMYGGPRKGAPAYMLLRDGDLVSAGGGPPFTYRSTDGGAVAVSASEAGINVAGNLVTLDLAKGEGWQWLERATPEEVSALRLVRLDKPTDIEREHLLRKVADGNPHVDLAVGDGAALEQALAVFMPRRLWIENVRLTEDVQGLIAAQSRLEVLAIKGDDKDGLAFLARVRGLRTLILHKWDPKTAGPIPDGMTGLRSLLVLGGSIKDLAPLGNLPRLRELTFWGTESLRDIGRLTEFPHLRVLVFQRCKGVADLQVLNNLKGLRWLGLPDATTPAQLGRVVREHPDLEILAVAWCGKIVDLTPIRRLERLSALVVATAAPLDPLYRMKTLKFLAVGLDKKKDDAESARVMAQVQQALPDTAVVRVAPLCLGSGWILLLVPLAALAWWLAARRRRRRPRPDACHV